MNVEILMQYFKKSLAMNMTFDNAEEDTITDRLDHIWYNQFTENDRRLVGYLLNEAYGGDKNVTANQAINKIITKLQEKPIMMNVFENKEDYLKLRNFWKKFHAEKKYAPVPQEFMRYDYDQRKIVVAGYHMVSPLGFRHHLVYMAAAGRDLSKGTNLMILDTIIQIRSELNYMRNRPIDLKKYWFELFGDAIDEKYYGAIMDRIKNYFDSRYEAFKVNGWKCP